MRMIYNTDPIRITCDRIRITCDRIRITSNLHGICDKRILYVGQNIQNLVQISLSSFQTHYISFDGLCIRTL